MKKSLCEHSFNNLLFPISIWAISLPENTLKICFQSRECRYLVPYPKTHKCMAYVNYCPCEFGYIKSLIELC